MTSSRTVILVGRFSKPSLIGGKIRKSEVALLRAAIMPEIETKVEKQTKESKIDRAEGLTSIKIAVAG